MVKYLKPSIKKGSFPFFALQFIHNLSLSIPYPIFASLILFDFATSEKSIIYPIRPLILGVLIAIFPLFQSIALTLVKKLRVSTLKKKHLLGLLLCELLTIVFIIYTLQINNLLLLLVARGSQGLFSVSIIYATEHFSSHSTKNPQYTPSSLIFFTNGSAFIIGILIGGLFSNSSISPSFSYQLPFKILLFCYILLFSLFYRLRFKNLPFQAAHIFKEKKLLKLSTLYVLFIAPWFALLQFFSISMHLLFHASLITITYALFSIGSLWLCGFFLKPLDISRVMGNLFFFLLAGILTFLLAFIKNTTSFITFHCIIAFAFGWLWKYSSSLLLHLKINRLNPMTLNQSLFIFSSWITALLFSSIALISLSLIYFLASLLIITTIVFIIKSNKITLFVD